MDHELRSRRPYPTDVSAEEWAFVATDLSVMAEDDERVPETVAGLHFVAFACLMLHRLVHVVAQSP